MKTFLVSTVMFLMLLMGVSALTVTLEQPQNLKIVEGDVVFKAVTDEPAGGADFYLNGSKVGSVVKEATAFVLAVDTKEYINGFYEARVIIGGQEDSNFIRIKNPKRFSTVMTTQVLPNVWFKTIAIICGIIILALVLVKVLHVQERLEEHKLKSTFRKDTFKPDHKDEKAKAIETDEPVETADPLPEDDTKKSDKDDDTNEKKSKEPDDVDKLLEEKEAAGPQDVLANKPDVLTEIAFSWEQEFMKKQEPEPPREEIDIQPTSTMVPETEIADHSLVQLMNYIQETKARGVPDHQIIENLKATGWPEQVILKHLR